MSKLATKTARVETSPALKVSCNRDALLDALAAAESVIPENTTKPTLLCVKLVASNHVMTVSATDLDTSIKYIVVKVDVGTEGQVTIPADKIREIASASGSEEVGIEVFDTSVAHIITGDSRSKVFINSEEFPAVPEHGKEKGFSILGGSLKRAIEETIYCTAKESTRYSFNGIQFNAKGGTVTLVSTDGRRLAITRCAGHIKNEDASRVVPAKALNLITKVFDPSEMVYVSFDYKDGLAFFCSPTAEVATHLVEGRFPPYKDVIPKNTTKKLTAEVGELICAIKRASVFCTNESKGILFRLSEKGSSLSSRSPESGETTVVLPCTYEGADMEIGFNPQFLIEPLSAIGSGTACLHLSESNRPGLLQCGSTFTYVLMPCNL